MATVFEMPLSTTLAAYSLETPLDGKLFRFQFKFNVRDSFWYMELSNGLTGELLRAGIKLVSQWDLLRLYQDPTRPAGQLVPVPQGEPGMEATVLGQLGKDVLLTYTGKT
jgi:hypothetical protein